MTTFLCSLCKAEHPALPPESKPDIAPEVVADLRAKFYAAVDKQLAGQFDPDKLAKQADKASMDYFTAIRYTGVERVPDTLKSVWHPPPRTNQGRSGGYSLQCNPSCPTTQEH